MQPQSFKGCGLRSDLPPPGLASGVRQPLPTHSDSTNTTPPLAAGNGSSNLRPPPGRQQTLAIAAAAVTLCKASAQFAAFTSALIRGATSNPPPPLPSGLLLSWVGPESGPAEISTWQPTTNKGWAGFGDPELMPPLGQESRSAWSRGLGCS